eukprot:scpid86517/ scgid15370/ 
MCVSTGPAWRLKFGLLASALVTVLLMITSLALVDWFDSSVTVRMNGISITFKGKSGLWKSCREVTVVPDTPALPSSSECGLYSEGNVGATFRTARAFALLAVIMTAAAVMWTVLLETFCKSMKEKTIGLLAPRLLFTAGGLFMLISAFSFLGVRFTFTDTVLQLTVELAEKYGAGYGVAWVSIIVCTVTAVLAHFHHGSIETTADTK